MKFICIGRNYAEHAKELNNPLPAEPVIFIKPDTALLPNKGTLYLPEYSNDVHYEIELIFKVCLEGKFIQPEYALKYVNQISVGIDFTARDVQEECKKKGLPWTKAKCFNGSAAVGEFIPISEIHDLKNISFELYQNGQIKQQGNSAMMLFDVPAIISYISTIMTLKRGDIIFTGTPAGVGKTNANDTLTGYLGGKKLLEIQVQ
jgi:2-keto-4-pentenoate hydratase/2-oxohepta-3-ene-1,7-dioic acid hydratase in catechol pathway